MVFVVLALSGEGDFLDKTFNLPCSLRSLRFLAPLQLKYLGLLSESTAVDLTKVFLSSCSL